MTLRNELIESILDLPDVDLRPSRFGSGEAFFVGRREFAHFHAGNEIDLRVTKKVLRTLCEDLEADRRADYRKTSDWLAFRFPRRKDLERALELVTLARDANR